MSIEELVSGLTAALNRNADATLKLAAAMNAVNNVGSAPDAKPAAEPAKPRATRKAEPAPAEEATAPAFTIDDVRAKLGKLPRAEVAKIIAGYNVEKLSDLPAARYEEVINTVNIKLAGANTDAGGAAQDPLL